MDNKYEIIHSRKSYRNRITCMRRNRKPCNSLLMVKVASDMDQGRVRTTTTTSRNVAAIQLIANEPAERRREAGEAAAL